MRRFSADPAAPREPPSLLTWHYRLQDAEPSTLAASRYGLIVVDYSRDGTATGEFTRADIALMQRTGKQVLAHLSIGEAARYRFYWRPGWTPGTPRWIERVNSVYHDNYLVRYWESEWQEVIGSYLDRILQAGYDGVYLDRVDAYAEFTSRRPSATADMISFVRRIAGQGRATRGRDFAVFIQNAEELAAHPELLGLISGIAREETYCTAGAGRTRSADTRETERWLDRYVAAGKTVLTVDYCDASVDTPALARRARRRGYVPFFTAAELECFVRDGRHAR